MAFFVNNIKNTNKEKKMVKICPKCKQVQDDSDRSTIFEAESWSA